MPDTRGRGAESTVRIGDGTRDAKSLPKELREIGEPCARKPARTVWRGEVEKGLAEIPLEGISGRSKASHSTSSAPYPTTNIVCRLTQEKHSVNERRQHFLLPDS